MSERLKIALEGGKWHRSGDVAVRGAAFVGGRLLDAAALAGAVQGCRSVQELADTVRCWNGFWALVIYAADCIYLVSDKIRSIPLFYVDTGRSVCIGDNADAVRKLAGIQGTLDPVSAAEFLGAGYVMGHRTILRELHQTQTGEIVELPDEPTSASPIRHRYFRYAHEDQKGKDEAAWRDAYERVCSEIFRRLLVYAHGRQIVIPLSGGYDSRLIVIMLQKLGVRNVLAFSYGKPGNLETRISRLVAQHLGIDWAFVPYSEERWRDWYRSREWDGFEHVSFNYAARPHFQDFPAVGQLAAEGRLEHDAVFVPGHAADLPAGSRSGSPLVRPAYFGRVGINSQWLSRTLLLNHFYRWPLGDNRSAVRDRLFEGIAPLSYYAGAAEVIDAWDIAERQPRFITNSVRVYEFWGYDWWLPFWDDAFIDFWQRVPNSLRLDKQLHCRLVNELDPLLARKVSSVESAPGVGKRMRRWLMQWPIVHRLYRPLARLDRDYRRTPFGWHGIIAPGTYYRLKREGMSDANGLIARLTLDAALHSPSINRLK